MEITSVEDLTRHPFVAAVMRKVLGRPVPQHEMDDLQQEVVVRALTQGYVEKYDAAKAKQSTYYYHLVRSVGVNYIEKQSAQRRARSVEAPLTDAEVLSEHDPRFREVEAAHLLDQLSTRLPSENLRGVFALLREGKNAAEIARELDIPHSTAAGYCRKALDILRDSVK